MQNFQDKKLTTSCEILNWRPRLNHSSNAMKLVLMIITKMRPYCRHVLRFAAKPSNHINNLNLRISQFLHLLI